MSATTMKTAADKATEKPQTENEKLDAIRSLIADLESSIAARQAREARLVAEREPLVLKSRVEKVPSAQDRLRTLDRELSEVRQDRSDDETALAEVRRQAVEAEQAIERGEWEKRRSAVRKIVQERLNPDRAAKLVKMADDLAAALQKANDEDEAAFIALVNFDRNLHFRWIKDLQKVRSHALSAKFRQDLLTIDGRELGRGAADISIEKQSREAYGRALDSLDNLELAF